MKLSRLALAALLAGCGSPEPQAEAAPPSAPKPVVTSPPGAPQLVLPVDCRIGSSCEVQNYVDRDPGPGVRDVACLTRSYQDHNGVDFRIPDMAAQKMGVEVLAAAAGRVARLRDGVDDVSVRVRGVENLQGQDCGNGVVIDHGDGWETQYCHLARGSIVVDQGAQVSAGQPIARIGLSGRTEYPHLHFTVRKDGEVIDPFAPDSASTACGSAGSLWTAETERVLAYQRGVVLNAGFAAGPVAMEAVEAGGLAPPDADAPALVAYARAVGLEAGDVQELVLLDPAGAVLARNRLAPLERPQAQHLVFTGKRAPAGGWPPGAYTGVYRVLRDGRVALERRFQIGL